MITRLPLTTHGSSDWEWFESASCCDTQKGDGKYIRETMKNVEKRLSEFVSMSPVFGRREVRVFCLFCLFLYYSAVTTYARACACASALVRVRYEKYRVTFLPAMLCWTLYLLFFTSSAICVPGSCVTKRHVCFSSLILFGLCSVFMLCSGATRAK